MSTPHSAGRAHAPERLHNAKRAEQLARLSRAVEQQRQAVHRGGEAAAKRAEERGGGELRSGGRDQRTDVGHQVDDERAAREQEVKHAWVGHVWPPEEAGRRRRARRRGARDIEQVILLAVEMDGLGARLEELDDDCAISGRDRGSRSIAY